MTIAEWIYRISHKKQISQGKKIPYYWQYSIFTILAKPIRKFFSAVVIPTIPYNSIRILCYRLCGYKIGKNVFIGMRCYLDDMCYDKIVIEDNVIISYGVFFACHGRMQGHNNILIKEGSYIGMRSSIIARNNLILGKNSIIGACALVNKSVPDNAVAVGVPIHFIHNEKLPPNSHGEGH